MNIVGIINTSLVYFYACFLVQVCAIIPTCTYFLLSTYGYTYTNLYRNIIKTKRRDVYTCTCTRYVYMCWLSLLYTLYLHDTLCIQILISILVESELRCWTFFLQLWEWNYQVVLIHVHVYYVNVTYCMIWL